MSAKTEYRCTVLFEDEVRAAATALARFFKPAHDLTAEECVSILETCFVALQGAEDESATLLLGKKPEAAATTPKGET